MENKFISKVETLREIFTTVLAQQFKIFTDHKNLTQKTLIPIAYYGGYLYQNNTARVLNILE